MEEHAMSQDELKRDVARIFTLASILAQKDGQSLTALSDPKMSRCYLGRAVIDYAELVTGTVVQQHAG
jgi:hypothetical protein